MGTVDEKGRPRTSVILQGTDAPPEQSKTASKADETRSRILDILRAAPDGLRAKGWQEEVEKKTGCKSSRFYEYRDLLLREEAVSKDGSIYRVSEPFTPITPIYSESEQMEQEIHSDCSTHPLGVEQSEYLLGKVECSEVECSEPEKAPDLFAHTTPPGHTRA